MMAYADTNFLTRLYIPTSDVAQVNHLMRRHLDHQGELLPFTPLHRLEFRNAIRLMVHRRKQPGEVNLSAVQARQVLRDQENDLAEAVFGIHLLNPTALHASWNGAQREHHFGIAAA